MTYPQPGQPQGPPPSARPPKKRKIGCLVAFLIVVVIAVPLAACGFGLWWWLGSGSGAVEQCFPAGTDGPLDTSHGTVACSHPNALWKITKEFDGPPPVKDVIAACGPDGDMLIYVAEVDKSYCLEDIN